MEGAGAAEAGRFPLILEQIDPAAAIDRDALPAQEAALLLETFSRRQGDHPPAADDPVPGKLLLVRGRMEDPDHLTGGPVVSGLRRDLHVGRDLSAGDGADRRLSPSFKGGRLSVQYFP